MVVMFFVILSILPFIMIISGSLSSTPAIIKNGYSVLIQDFTLDAYRMIFRFPEEIGRSYAVSISVTVIGTLVGLVLMSMAAELVDSAYTATYHVPADGNAHSLGVVRRDGESYSLMAEAIAGYECAVAFDGAAGMFTVTYAPARPVF